MKQKLTDFINKFKENWQGFSKKTKILIVGSFVVTLLTLILIIFFASRTDFAPLYTDLSPQEAGQIKAAIEEMGIPVELSSDGTMISVPKEEVANLKVVLATEGIPETGNVDYSVFSENLGLGMTDRQFDVVERDAMQNELAYLIEQIDGVKDANVMITLPEKSIWVTDEEQFASASVVIQGEPSFELNQKQVNGLYHLISKSIPNLPEDQIVIMNQFGHVYELQDEFTSDTTLTVYQQQRQIKKDIEQDLQKELQQMLGLLLGHDKVVVSVLTNIDFTKEKREENLVEAPNTETNEGLEISVERIIESYSNTEVDGTTGTGEGEIPNYPSSEPSGNSESERTEERINREVNRIHRQIETSPYVIDDITINVGVEPPNPENPATLTQQTIDDISTLLKNMVSTSLSMNGTELTDEELDQRISVFATEFHGKPSTSEEATEPIEEAFPTSLLMLIGAGVAILLIIINLIILLRRRRKLREQEVDDEEQELDTLNNILRNNFEEEAEQFGTIEMEESDLEELQSDTPQESKRKQIEKLAKERPDDFVNLLRSWMAQD